jgi:hypothetical protein
MLDTTSTEAAALRADLSAARFELARLRAQLAAQAKSHADEILGYREQAQRDLSNLVTAQLEADQLRHERDQAEAQRDAAIAQRDAAISKHRHVPALTARDLLPDAPHAVTGVDPATATFVARLAERCTECHLEHAGECDEDGRCFACVEMIEPSYIDQAESDYRATVMGGCL